MTDNNNVARVRISDVSKVWGRDGNSPLVTLQDINLDVYPGEFLVFLGPSGCGKSTLLYLIAGLQEISGGTIEYDGQPVTGPSSDRSLIFQETSLYPWLTIIDNVAFGLALRGMPKNERHRIATEVLKKVGLGQFLHKRPDELSGGMRQRAAVARALTMQPKLLMMDEPFAALDIQTRSKLQDFLIQIWQESQASILFVTHHIDEAVALADRVVVFTSRPGRIKSIVPIDLPRPRDPHDPEFHRLRDLLADQLRDEVDNAFRQQEVA